MKPIAEQEATRRSYDPVRNSVHRSSLLVPRLPGSKVDVSFVNHFLLKRGYRDVVCRTTPVLRDGTRLSSESFPVTGERVYRVALDKAHEGREDVSSFIVEFFSAANLYIPYPAVLVNHRGPTFLNSVHSYNRALNDVFEDDEVNAENVAEASVDVRVGKDIDTFMVFTAGPFECRGPLSIGVRTHEGVDERTVTLAVPRFANRVLSLREIIGADVPEDAVVTVRQPRQPLFYGRMLAGQRLDADGAFTANHTFCDCSGTREYWDDNEPSARVYPLFPGLKAEVRFHPIFSPCVLAGALDIMDAKGRGIATIECPALDGNSSRALRLPVSELITSRGLEGASSFRYRAWAREGGTPRRLNHQLVYGDGRGRSPLHASTAISLRNPHAFRSSQKRGTTWGQCTIGGGFDSWLGLVFDGNDAANAPIRLRVFTEEGLIGERVVTLPVGAADVLSARDLAPDLVERASAQPAYVWYWAESERSDLAAYTVVQHRESGHCSGEHSF